MAIGPIIVVALDFFCPRQALACSTYLDPHLCRVKVGKELFTAAGPQLVEALQRRGFQVFLDLKFHDIPNTVAAACKVAADLGVWMVNVHALGGKTMLEAARKAIDGPTRPWLIAVTLLTSSGPETLREIGINGDVEETVLRLARLAADTELDGVVCSAQELIRLRADLGQQPIFVTPGIRPAGAAQNDQRRTLTPQAALQAGADYLVIGRPITRAADPGAALASISQQLVAGG